MKTVLRSFLILALLGSMSLVSCRNGVAKEQERDYLSEVKSVNKLVLAQMTISKMATVDDIDLAKAEGLREIAAGLIDALKVGDRKAAYSYDTYLRAYIDLSGVTADDINVDHAAKTITLTLPQVQTEFVGRDLQIREDHYRVTGLRSRIDARERAGIKEHMNEALRREVEEKSEFRSRLEKEARSKCAAYFQSVLGGDGYDVVVNFR